MRRGIRRRGRVYSQKGGANGERDSACDVAADLQWATADAVDEEEEDELGDFADYGIYALVEEGLGGGDADLREDGGREVLDCRDAGPILLVLFQLYRVNGVQLGRGLTGAGDDDSTSI